MNTKICPSCNQVNPVEQAFCHKCGRQFKTTAPLANQQDDPKTIVGSFSPNVGQQNYNQPNFNQPNFNQPNFNQPPKKSNSKAMWWIGGALVSLALIGVVASFLIIAVISYEEEKKDSGSTVTPNTSSSSNLATGIQGKWRNTATGGANWFDANNRYSTSYANGTIEYGTYTVIGNQQIQLKSDSGALVIFSASINGNTLLISKGGQSSTLTRIP